MRLWFALMGLMLWAGIYFTGFSKVNLLLYLPATGLIMASIIGVCPAHIAIHKLLGVSKNRH
jgi:hypothetical protein